MAPGSSHDKTDLNSTFIGHGGDGAPDLDEGFHVDEADDGDLIARFVGVSVHGNHDEGLDLDEDGQGGARVTAIRLTTAGNHDEGFKVDEAEPGDMVVSITASEISDRQDQQGVELTEEGDPHLGARVVNTHITGNHNDGFEASRDDAGTGSLLAVNSDLSGHGGDGALDLDGVTETLINVIVD